MSLKQKLLVANTMELYNCTARQAIKIIKGIL